MNTTNLAPKETVFSVYQRKSGCISGSDLHTCARLVGPGAAHSACHKQPSNHPSVQQWEVSTSAQGAFRYSHQQH